MSAIRTFITRLLRDERGLETVEYAIIVGLIVAGLIVSIAAIGAWVTFRFETLLSGVDAGLAGAGGPGSGGSG